MYKYLILSLLFFICAPLRTYSLSETNIINIDQIIKTVDITSEQGNTRLMKETSGLSEADRQLLYSKYEKISGFIFLGNLAIPGIGSFIAGDINGGLTAGITVLSGLALTVVPLSLAVMRDAPDIFLYMIFIGIPVFVIGEIINLAIPFAYSDLYNKQLRQGLNLTKENSSVGLDYGYSYCSTVPNKDMLKFQFTLIEMEF